MTWHQWHQTAPISRRMGLSSARARAKASSPHSYHSTGWWAAERRYGLAELARRLGCSALKFFLPSSSPLFFLPEGASLHTALTARDYSGRYHPDRGACARRSLHSADARSGCALRRGASKDKPLRY